MKTIKEVSQEYANALCTPEDKPAPGTYRDVNEYLRSAFEEGAEHVQKWYSVNDSPQKSGRYLISWLDSHDDFEIGKFASEIWWGLDERPIYPQYWRVVNFE
ncbi:MAG: hypothetical protein LBQ73_07155 [Tannerellaceae bacterium]|jgi:hypothetical protein|nr:hypothetical protein [Tannerellaceae bacterium]